MKRFIVFIAFSMAAFTAVANVPNELSKSANGEVRYLGFIKVYDATLFTQTNATPENILNPNVSRCLKLNYSVDLSKDKFVLATKTVLERQNSAEQLQKVAQQTQAVNNSYTDIKKGDRYLMCFDGRTEQTKLYLNDSPVLTLQNSAEFAKVYMGMWLANKQPISVTLRERFMNAIQNSDS